METPAYILPWATSSTITYHPLGKDVTLGLYCECDIWLDGKLGKNNHSKTSKKKV